MHVKGKTRLRSSPLLSVFKGSSPNAAALQVGIHGNSLQEQVPLLVPWGCVCLQTL